MNGIVFDYPAINRRLNRKPEPVMAWSDYEKRMIPENSAARVLMGVGYDPSEVELLMKQPAAAVPALRAEIEQMERELDILGLRLLADEALNGRDR